MTDSQGPATTFECSRQRERLHPALHEIYDRIVEDYCESVVKHERGGHTSFAALGDLVQAGWIPPEACRDRCAAWLRNQASVAPEGPRAIPELLRALSVSLERSFVLRPPRASQRRIESSRDREVAGVVLGYTAALHTLITLADAARGERRGALWAAYYQINEELRERVQRHLGTLPDRPTPARSDPPKKRGWPKGRRRPGKGRRLMKRRPPCETPRCACGKVAERNGRCYLCNDSRRRRTRG